MNENQDQDPILLQLNEDVHMLKVMDFAKDRDGVLRYQGRLYSPSMNDIHEKIM